MACSCAGSCVRCKEEEKYSAGGLLTGKSHAQGGIRAIVDGTEPIEVESGEYIIRKDRVDELGVEFFDKLNSGQIKPGVNFKNGGQIKGNNRKYQNGGSVGVTPGGASGNFPTQTTRMNKKLNGAKSVESKLFYTGVTSNNAGHRHKYTIFNDGTVRIYDAIHPKTRQIKHNHQYVGKWPGGHVTEAKSSCEPRCEELYGYPGAPLHGHHLAMTDEINGLNNKSDRKKQIFAKRYIGNRFSVPLKGFGRKRKIGKYVNSTKSNTGGVRNNISKRIKK